jgi:uncharacterized protein (TIGR02246 family)
MSVDKPEDVPIRFQEFWNLRDARSLANLFVEDADFVNVVGIWWQSKDDIYKAHDYGLKVIFNHSNLKVTKVKVRMIGDDVAIVHSRMRLKGQSRDSDRKVDPGTRYNVFSFVCKRDGAEWKIVSAHNTDIVPGAETNLKADGKLQSADYRKKGTVD